MASEKDYVKLAQLYSVAGTSKKIKYEFLNQININYSVPDESEIKKSTSMILPGYTALHISVMRSDLDLMLELVSRGANVLKQGTFDKWTPLHLVVYITDIRQQMVWDVSNMLKKYTLIDTLLTAHVNTGNTINPTCKEGLSHLHIACMFNHAQAVQFLTNENLINQATSPNSLWPGYTALHFAVKYSCITAAKILITDKADVHLKDATGMSPLQLMIDRIINLTDSLTFGKPPNRSIIEKKDILLHEAELKAEVEAIEYIIQFTLKVMQTKNVNYTDHTGLTVFHAACVQKCILIFHDIVASVTNVNLPIDSDSPFWPGWTALHFAALCNIEAVKLLVELGADLNIKNTAGDTPLDFCLKKYPPIVIHDILSLREDYKNVLFTDGTTKLLDVIQLMSASYKFCIFLESLDNVNISISPDSPIWPGYSLLHLAVRMNEIPTRIFCYNDSVFGIFYSFEDFHSVMKSEAITFWDILSVCLSKGCSLTIKNTDGLTPIHLAFYLHKSVVVAELIKHCKEDVVDSKGLSHFHIACALDQPFVLCVINEFIKRRVNINSPVSSEFEWHNELLSKNEKPCMIKVHVNSTPLHIAVIFKNEEVVEYLLNYGADVYAKDALGLTPIHLSMASTKSISHLLLTNAPDLMDVNVNGLSYLHVAAFANNDMAITKLLQDEAKADIIFQDCTSINLLSDFVGNTPLHVAVKVNSDIAVSELLRGGGCKIDTEVFSSGITALHFACSKFDQKMAMQLLEMGANPNAQVYDDDDYDGPWKGYTPLHLLIYQAAMHQVDSDILLDMLELLLKHGADGLIENRNGYTPMMMAYDVFYKTSMEGEEIDENSSSLQCSASAVNILYNNVKNFDFNPANSDGFTLFHLACMKNDVKAVQRFLDNGVDVNLATDHFGRYKGSTPLHVALFYSASEVACLLTERGADVKVEDVDGNTPMHFAVTWTLMKDLSLAQLMLRKGADVNAKNVYNQTPMDCHLKSRYLTIHILKFLYDNGSEVDISAEGLIGLAMQNALANDGQLIFPLLVEICDLTIAIEDGFHAIHSLVSVASESELDKSTYLECIEQMLKMGCELDEQDERGKTALYKAVQHHNVEATEALLSLGADVNIVDNTNHTPFTAIVRELEGTDKNAKFRQIIASTARAVAKQLWKIDFVQLYMNNHNQTFYEQYIKKMYRGHPREEKFHEEITMMNSVKICESLCLGDFMAELKAVAVYPRMLMWERQIVDHFFSCTEEILEALPQLCGVLLMQYRKAKARRRLIEQCKIVMDSLWPIHVPDLCSIEILNYLTSDEMKILIGKHNMSNPHKRRKLE